MSTVHSATAHAPLFSRLSTHLPRWNNRFFLLGVLTGVGITLFVAYRFFRQERVSHPKLDLSQRYLATIFPNCANISQRLPFNQFAMGIIKLDPKNLPESLIGYENEIFFDCLSSQNTSFFYQPMASGTTLEIFIPAMPYQEEITVNIVHQQKVILRTKLKVEHEMGLYQILPDGKIKSHAYSPPKIGTGCLFNTDTRNPDSPFSITIEPNGEVKFSEPPGLKFLLLQNNSQLTHILFFKIVCPSPAIEIIVPLVVSCWAKILPKEFLRQCWENHFHFISGENPPAHLELRYIQDAIIPLS